MKIYFHQTAGGNVGDDMNAVLWRRLLPELDELTSADWLVGAGTIVDQRLNSLPGRKVVMGSGFRPGGAHVPLSDEVRFAAVRGFLSAERCGLERELAVCDPGFLVSTLWPMQTARSGRIGFVPHVYSEQYSHIAAAAADADFDVISPTLPLEEFLQRLSTCSRVYCESLHSAIFADALRIPWARVRICSSHYEGVGVADFKWSDSFSVLGTASQAINNSALIPVKRTWSFMHKGIRPLQSIVEKRLVRTLVQRRDDASIFRLSPAERLQERVTELMARVQQLRSAEQASQWRAAPRGARVAAQRRAGGPALRVLAFPKGGQNAYLQNFSGSLEAGGATVDDFNFWRAFFVRYDVVHIHWPDTHLRTHSWWRAVGKHVRLALMCVVLRARATRIVWMMHNLKTHEKDHWISAMLFPLWFPRLCTHVIALTNGGLTAAQKLYPDLLRRPAAVVPHGHYRTSYPAAPQRPECREQLGLRGDRFTFLFFGNIRRYKNVPALIEAFRQIRDPALQLVIAGLPVLGMEAQDLQAQAAGDERIHMHLKFIPDEEVPRYIGAADIVVLPFDSILNSGSVLLALSFNRPVLAPRLGALPEIQHEVGERWLQLYEGPLSPQVVAQAGQNIPGQDEVANLSAFDWDRIGTATLDFYTSPGRGPAAIAAVAKN